MANELQFEVRFDAEGFRAELLRRLALTSGTEENLERIAIDLINEESFVHIGPERDILDSEFLDEK